MMVFAEPSAIARCERWRNKLSFAISCTSSSLQVFAVLQNEIAHNQSLRKLRRELRLRKFFPQSRNNTNERDPQKRDLPTSFQKEVGQRTI